MYHLLVPFSLLLSVKDTLMFSHFPNSEDSVLHRAPSVLELFQQSGHTALVI